MAKMPVLFVGHGSPMNLIEDNEFTRSLRDLSAKLPRPQAICVVSSHWQTSGTRICCNTYPRQIYDFFGFPQDLYEIIYEPEGASELAIEAAELLGGDKYSVQCNNRANGDADWGNDHAAWSILYHLYPQADIPTFYISTDMDSSAKQHAELGRKLNPLRSKGVLLIGSGNIVHNLFDLNPIDINASPDPLGVEFDTYIQEALVANDLTKIIDYQQCGSPAKYSAPTPDHILPLLWIGALRDMDDHISFPCTQFQNKSISMRSVLIGQNQNINERGRS